MPFYDFRCPTCDERYEVRRPISESDQPTSCPQGHEGGIRVITTWGTGSAIRSGTPAKTGKKVKGDGPLESAARKIAQHKRHGPA